MSTATITPQATTTTTQQKELTAVQKKVLKQVKSTGLFRLFMLKNLPLGLISGMRIVEVSRDKAVSVIKLSWLTRNPFNTTYFAALSMAAEACNGALTLAAVKGEGVATFPVGMTADFTKAARGRTYFTCDSGPEFFAAVAETKATGEPVTVDAVTIGRNSAGDEVCRFVFTWSFKRRG